MAIDDMIQVTGPQAKAKTIMDILLTLQEISREKKIVVLKDVMCIPGGQYNLFSIIKMMRLGKKRITGWVRHR